MMVLYGLVRCIAVALRWKAARAHAWAKTAYEAFEESFKAVEVACKAEEVELGRPVDYGVQLRLLRSFERAEKARQRWVRSAHRLAKREAFVSRVQGFENARVPYTFGLIDMTVVMRALDYFGMTPEFTVSGLVSSIRSLLI